MKLESRSYSKNIKDVAGLNLVSEILFDVGIRLKNEKYLYNVHNLYDKLEISVFKDNNNLDIYKISNACQNYKLEIFVTDQFQKSKFCLISRSLLTGIVVDLCMSTYKKKKYF